MPEKQILAKKTYVDNNLNNVVRNVNGVVSIPNTQVELSQKIVTTTEEDPDTHEEITTDEVVTESYLDKTKLHIEDSYSSKTAEYGVNEIILNGSTITGITDNASGSSSTLAVSQRALSNFKQVEANPVGQATADLTTIKIDNTIYELDAGTNVSITPTISTGTKIADYSIDGANGSLYAPDGGGGGSTPVTPSTVATNKNNTDSAGSQTVYFQYTGSQEITVDNFLKDLTYLRFRCSPNPFWSTTNFTEYNSSNNILTYSWGDQSGTSRQWFDIYFVEDISVIHTLSNWKTYDTEGDYTFTVPQDILAENIILDFRNVHTGGEETGEGDVTKTVQDGVLTVHLPFPQNSSFVSIEMRVLYLKTAEPYSRVKANPEETPVDDLNTIDIDGVIYDIAKKPINYSTTEQLTGQKWIDGSNIYQKTIYFAGGTSGGQYNIPHGVSNLDKVIYLEGFYTDSSGDNPHMLLPRIATDGYHIGINSITNTYIIMTFNQVWGDRLTDIYVTIKYTKSS